LTCTPYVATHTQSTMCVLGTQHIYMCCNTHNQSQGRGGLCVLQHIYMCCNTSICIHMHVYVVVIYVKISNIYVIYVHTCGNNNGSRGHVGRLCLLQHTHTHTHTHTYIYIYMYICVVLVYVNISNFYVIYVHTCGNNNGS